jgi:uroporphyrinogen-III decarboxylase
MLTDRERFIKTIKFEDVDRVPFIIILGPWGSAVQRWYSEGLEPNKSWADGFDFDKGWVQIPVNLGLNPPFKAEIIKETADEIIHRDDKGIVKRDKRSGNSMPEFLEYPVKNWDDWERMKKERLDPDDPGRFPSNWEATLDAYNKTDQAVWMGNFPYGIFGTPRDILGAEELLVSFHTEPDLVKDMMNYLTDFWIRLYEKVTAKVKVDCIHIWEDMSYKGGMLISPTMFREFMTPCYKRITDFAQANNVDIVSVDSDGDCSELAELLVDAGVNLLWPFERQAGNDLLEYRRRFPRLGMMGGFDKTAMAKGKEAIDQEMEIISEMLKFGGFIPSPDHLIPHDVSWDNFKYFCHRLKETIGK